MTPPIRFLASCMLALGVLALLLAAVFWRMGVAVQRRARSGDGNSLWAHTPRSPHEN